MERLVTDMYTFKGKVEDCENDYIIAVQEKLRHYEDLAEQGRLIKLPCKVGDTVWFVGNEFVNDYEVRRFIIDETGIDCIQIAKEINGKDYWNGFSIYDFGKTVFLNKSEAEAKLKELER